MDKKLSPTFVAFLQATGLVLYIILISVFINYIIPNFANKNEKFYAPIIMLLLFIISAVISASFVLGRSALLFWEKRYKEAFTLVGMTVGWGIFYFVLIILLISKS